MPPRLYYYLAPDAANTTARVDLWIRAVDGDDDNPGTALAPLKTIQAAIKKISALGILHTVVFHIGTHVGAGYAGFLLPAHLLRANIWFDCDGGGAPGDDGCAQLAGPFTVAAGSTTGKIVTTGPHVIDAYMGKTIEILTGPAAGDRKTIDENTTTDFYPEATFSALPVAGDTFRIFEPKTSICLPPGSVGGQSTPMIIGCGQGARYTLLSGSTGRVFIVNAKIRPDPSMAYDEMQFLDSSVVLLGTEFATNVLGFAVERSQLSLGIEDNAYPMVIPSAYADLGVRAEAWYGWGHYSPLSLARSNWHGGVDGFTDGFLVGAALVVYDTNFSLAGGRLFGVNHPTTPTLEVYGGRSSNGMGYTYRSNRGLRIHGAHASSPAVRCRTAGASFFQYASITGLGDGVVCYGGNQVWLIVGPTNVRINVTGIGLRLSRTGKAEIMLAGANAGDIVGATGDVSVDDGATTFGGETIIAGTKLFDATEGTALWV